MSTAEIEKHWVKIYLYERANVVHASELAQLDPVLDAHTRRFCYSADSPVTSSLECKPPTFEKHPTPSQREFINKHCK